MSEAKDLESLIVTLANEYGPRYSRHISTARSSLDWCSRLRNFVPRRTRGLRSHGMLKKDFVNFAIVTTSLRLLLQSESSLRTTPLFRSAPYLRRRDRRGPSQA